MAGMRYVRPFDAGEAVGTGSPGHRVQVLSHLESALMLASHTEKDGCGPGLHYHRGDKLYYVLRGTMKVRLGDDVHQVEAGTLVFVPAGLAHRTWNEGTGAESHFEMIVPAPSPMAEIDLPVGSPADVPAEHRAGRPGYVRRVDPAVLTEALPGMRVQSLADPESGSEHTMIFYVEVGAGDAGPAAHIHEFDQYYLVLQGRLTVEVALQKHVVEAPSLVLLPAGVPHRQYNDGSATEKHLAIVSPMPEPGRPVDRKVLFAAKDEAPGGAPAPAAPAGARA
jgi:quercetin dioxygenase-like cupin family protein